MSYVQNANQEHSVRSESAPKGRETHVRETKEKRHSKLRKEAPDYQELKDFLREYEVGRQRRFALWFFFVCFVFSLVSTFAIFFLQGFHAWGFSLESELLMWLGGATIGELGVLALSIYGYLFRH